MTEELHETHSPAWYEDAKYWDQRNVSTLLHVNENGEQILYPNIAKILDGATFEVRKELVRELQKTISAKAEAMNQPNPDISPEFLAGQRRAFSAVMEVLDAIATQLNIQQV